MQATGLRMKISWLRGHLHHPAGRAKQRTIDDAVLDVKFVMLK
jgi:hypothetical protein